MKLAAICAIAVGIAASIAVVIFLWRPWTSASNVCDGLKDWRNAQSDFLIQTNKPDSRGGPGFTDSNHIFERAATIILPEADSGDGQVLRELARKLVRVEEEWMSDLGVMNAYASTNTGTSSQRVDAYQREESTRVEMNDELRELNAKLVNQCGAQPLPLYSSTT